MQVILHKTNWFSATATALLIVCLWSVLAVSGPSSQASEQLKAHQQAANRLTLPNIMAPVIRKEVRTEGCEEEQHYSRRLPVAEQLRSLVQFF